MDEQKPIDNEEELKRLGFKPQDTFIVENKLALRRLLGLPTTDETEPTIPEREITILIRGMPEKLVLSENLSVVLGRSDLAIGFKPDVDLAPYGAATRGVSRSHARLHMENHQLYVTDLESANGTFLGDERLQPNQPVLVHSGSNILLGALGIQVVFS